MVAAFGDTAPPIQAGIADAVADARPDAVLFLGDAVDRHSRWRRRLALRRWARDMEPLAGRILAVGGNHDFEQDGGLAGYSDALDRLSCPDEHRVRFSVEIGEIHVVGVTVPHGADAISADDLEWCETAFGQARRAAARVVAVHQPLFPIAGRIGISLDADPISRDTFLRLLEGWGVHAVLCGHEHLYSRRSIGAGLTQLVCGGGGAQPERAVFGHGDFTANRPHFVTLTLTAGELAIEARSPDGQVIDRLALRVAT